VSAGSERRVPAMRIELRASRTLAGALAAAHAASVAAVLAAAPAAHWSLLAAGLAAASACCTIRRHALLRGRAAVTALELYDECDCNATRRDGSRSAWRIEGSSFVSAWLIVLHLRAPGRRLRRRITLVPDSIGAACFRRLRVRLRWCRTADEVAAAGPPL
jgi:hypothetical protein